LDEVTVIETEPLHGAMIDVHEIPSPNVDTARAAAATVPAGQTHAGLEPQHGCAVCIGGQGTEP
jgi:hypothetical protein